MTTPTLSQLEYAWSRSDEVQALIVPMMQAAFDAERRGFRSLHQTFYQRELFDDDGELLYREHIDPLTGAVSAVEHVDERASRCVLCDALPGKCEHNVARYIGDIVYERVEKHGRLVGWRVPDRERERWDAGPMRVGPTKEPGPEPRPIQQLVVELEAHVALDTFLEGRLRDVYAREPLRVTTLVDAAIAKTQAGNLRNPPGWLASRLKTM